MTRPLLSLRSLSLCIPRYRECASTSWHNLLHILSALAIDSSHLVYVNRLPCHCCTSKYICNAKSKLVPRFSGLCRGQLNVCTAAAPVSLRYFVRPRPVGLLVAVAPTEEASLVAGVSWLLHRVAQSGLLHLQNSSRGCQYCAASNRT